MLPALQSLVFMSLGESGDNSVKEEHPQFTRCPPQHVLHFSDHCGTFLQQLVPGVSGVVEMGLFGGSAGRD